jgi:hypothetical protein
MVRRPTARKKLRARRQVCANVFGLWWSIAAPRQDELRSAKQSNLNSSESRHSSTTIDHQGLAGFQAEEIDAARRIWAERM